MDIPESGEEFLTGEDAVFAMGMKHAGDVGVDTLCSGLKLWTFSTFLKALPESECESSPLS